MLIVATVGNEKEIVFSNNSLFDIIENHPTNFVNEQKESKVEQILSTLRFKILFTTDHQR